jgi:hypothetical protein
MLIQSQADRLIAMLKEAALAEAFVWEQNRRQDELFVAAEDKKIQFYLSLKRNPFEIRLHLRTRDRDIGLVRVDNHAQHTNPDGTKIRDTPHIHVYREGFDLDWAEPITWYDANRPLETLARFLDFVHARFPGGYQLAML